MSFNVATSQAERIEAVRPARAQQIHPIFVGTNWFDEILRMIHEHVGDHTVAVVTDEVVASLQRDKLEQLHNSVPRMRRKTVEVSELGKQLRQFITLQEFLLEHEVHNDDFIISMGGGAIDDIVGFVAATYMRGIQWLSIPTSFMAQLDSAIGGRRSVNLGSFKSYCGTFYWPNAIFVDLEFLTTQDDRSFRLGVPKLLRTALVGNQDLLKQVAAASRTEGVAGIRKRANEFILPTIKTKTAVSSADPYQQGLLSVMETGHTTAHALEGASKLRMTHGEALSIGLAFESFIAEKRGMISAEDRKDLLDTLECCDLPTELPAELHDRELIHYMGREKLNRGREIVCVLPYHAGRAVEEWPASRVALGISEMWSELSAYRLARG